MLRRRLQSPLGQPATRASSPVPSRPCGPASCGPSGPSCSWSGVPATWPCSTSTSTASSAAAISSPCASMTWRPTATPSIARQSKTGRPLRFELTEVTRHSLDEYLRATGRSPGQCLFPGRRGPDQHLTTRQYARLVSEWVSGIGLDPLKYATHSMRRTKATLIHRRTGNLRAVQLLLRHNKIESTVRYLGVEVDDALEIAEKIEV